MWITLYRHHSKWDVICRGYQNLDVIANWSNLKSFVFFLILRVKVLIKKNKNTKYLLKVTKLILKNKVYIVLVNRKLKDKFI